MRTSKKMTVAYRRKREGKTNYKKRIKLLMSKKTRLVIRKCANSIKIQFIDYSSKGDKVVASANTKQLIKKGWSAGTKSLPTAYLVGLLAGKNAKQKKVNDVILDIGLQNSIKGGRLYSCLKGIIDSGITINHSKEIFPKEDRINGKHISSYAQKLQKESKDKYEKQFSQYIKNGVDPIKIPDLFADVKDKIRSEK